MSIRLLAGESIVMMVFSLTYLLNLIVEDETDLSASLPPLLICAAIGLYESINFLYYLFFHPVLEENYSFAYKIYDASRYSLIIYWLIMGLAIFYNRKNLHYHTENALAANDQ
ncbi:MAG: hypothetical protein U0U70_16495 [Chitinophagaceae bacterium]